MITLLLTTADTLTAAYSEKWSAPAETSQLDMLFTSAELWPVVFGVTLIIWSVLLLNLYRIEKRISALEKNKADTSL